MTYREALDYLYSFTNFEVTPAGNYTSKTFDLSRMDRLLAALGDPQRSFQSIHIAGTKGKGSTAAMIESILRVGYHTGLYTSPHLHTFRERIRVDGEMISRDQVVAGIEKIKPVADRLPQVTTFEIMTALAFDYFRARTIEFAVLEVGLGGRLDATNVVQPRVSVITSISYDHTAILGHTLSEIAREKAGIIKPHVPCVTAPQRPEAHETISQVAREKDSPLIAISDDLKFQLENMRFQVVQKSSAVNSQSFALEQAWDASFELNTYDLPLTGRHQLTNAATALAAIALLRERGIDIPERAVRQGLARVEWHGRFEVLQQEPFIVLDGAHNAESARRLFETIQDVRPHRPIHLIFGASNDKDIEGMFQVLLPHVESLILTRSHNPRAADPVALSKLAEKYHAEASIVPHLGAALLEAQERAAANDVICVTGSLFVVAEAREAWLKEHGELVEKDT